MAEPESWSWGACLLSVCLSVCRSIQLYPLPFPSGPISRPRWGNYSYRKHRGFGDPIDIQSGEDPNDQWTPSVARTFPGEMTPPPLSLPTRHRRDEHRGAIGAPVSVATRSWPIWGKDGPRSGGRGGGCSPCLRDLPPIYEILVVY